MRAHTLYLFVLASAVVQAQPQDLMRHVEPNQCDALLKDGVFDEHYVFGSPFQTKVFLNRFCSVRYSSVQQASQDAQNLGVPLGQLMAAFGFSGSQTTFQTDYQTLCAQQDSFAAASQSLAERIRIANANLAQAFARCVNGTPFVAYVAPMDPKQFQLIVAFHPQSSDRPTARIDGLKYDNALVACDKPPRTVGSTGLTLNCRRNDEKQAVQLALNTSEGTRNFQIPAYEPPAPPLAITSAVGDVVMSLLPPDKFSAQHPGQTWILCGTPEQPAPPGSAWANLMAGAPLPDCGGRYPRAFQAGVTPTAGRTQEDRVGEHTHLIQGRHLEANKGKGFEGSGFKSNSDADAAWDADFPTLGVTGAGNDKETRPKTFIVNVYIRVN